MFEDAKDVIRAKQQRNTDNKMIKRKRTNNDLQNTTQKTHLFYANIQDIIVSNDYSAVDILYVIFKKKR